MNFQWVNYFAYQERHCQLVFYTIARYLIDSAGNGDSKTDMSNVITSFLFLFLFLFLHIGKVIANSINTFDRIGKLFIYEFHYFIVTDILGEEILNSLCLFFFSFRSQDWNANFSQLLIIVNRGKFSLGN